MFGKPEVWTGVVSGAESSRSVNYSGGSGYNDKPGTVSLNFGGSNRAGRRASASTTHHLNLLLDGRPVLFSGSTPAQLRDGDRAVLGGTIGDGTLKANAYRNLTTGAVHKGSGTLLMIIGVLFVVVGVPFSLLLIGIPFVAIGAFLIWLALKQGKLNKMVDAAAAAAGGGGPADAGATATASSIVS